VSRRVVLHEPSSILSRARERENEHIVATRGYHDAEGGARFAEGVFRGPPLQDGEVRKQLHKVLLFRVWVILYLIVLIVLLFMLLLMSLFMLLIILTASVVVYHF